MQARFCPDCLSVNFRSMTLHIVLNRSRHFSGILAPAQRLAIQPRRVKIKLVSCLVTRLLSRAVMPFEVADLRLHAVLPLQMAAKEPGHSKQKITGTGSSSTGSGAAGGGSSISAPAIPAATTDIRIYAGPPRHSTPVPVVTAAPHHTSFAASAAAATASVVTACNANSNTGSTSVRQ